jgi:DNA-binding transcriptional MerR regulator
MDEVLMRIGEIAAFFQVSVKAIRIYEKMGILKPAKVDTHTGYRYYTPDQVKQLDALLELRELGFSLTEIQKLLANGVTKDRYMEALTRKKMMWQDKLSQAKDRMDAIEEIIERLHNETPPVTPHDLTEDERARVLNGLACFDLDLHDVHGRNILSETLWL